VSLHATLTHVENPGPLKLAAKTRSIFMASAAIGALAVLGGIIVDPLRGWQNYMQGFWIFNGFALGGIFFVALNHAVGAKWAVIPRRLGEAFGSFLPVGLVLFLILLFGIYSQGEHLYKWMGTDDEIWSPTKNVWLSFGFFAIRNVVFFLIWIFFANKLTKLSLAQDSGGNAENSRTMPRWSIAYLILFALTFALHSFDLLMSLEPKWFSTMFPVYCFVGVFQSTLALMGIVFMRLKKDELHAVATSSHVKDIGTLLFAFTVFMCYVGFSQFMLIWYANLPEETFYYIKRFEGGWLGITFIVLVLKFVIPFFGLLGQGQKRAETWFNVVCWSVLIGQFLDVYWMSMPSNHAHFVPVSWNEIGTLLFFAGVFGLVVSRFMSKHSLIPAGDPNVLASANWRFWE
jgi:hypothetical protein